MSKAQLGQPAPLLPVAEWVQGEAINFGQLCGKVVLLEVFKVNCPGCFLYSLPQAITLHQRYHEQGLMVIGVATAFEDFDKNTLENLQRLLEKSEVIGETLKTLTEYGQLSGDRLPYRIPFPVAMDSLCKQEGEVTDSAIDEFIADRAADFRQQPAAIRQNIREQVKRYFQNLMYRAETFELFDLKGTPSQLLIDKRGLLRTSRFGHYPELEADIQALLQEE